MKILLSAIFISLMSVSYCQVNFPINEKGKIEFAAVESVDSVSKDILFGRAKLFIAQSFKSAKSVIEMEDLSSGTIYIKGIISVNVYGLGASYPFGHVSFNMTIQCKDNKYRYSVTDFVHSNPERPSAVGGNLENDKPISGTLFVPKKYWSLVKEQTNESVKQMIIKLKESMLGGLKSHW